MNGAKDDPAPLSARVVQSIAVTHKNGHTQFYTLSEALQLRQALDAAVKKFKSRRPETEELLPPEEPST